MKKSRFSEAEIVSILKQAELGLSVQELIRRYGVSEQTFYRWKKAYGGMSGSEVRELRELRQENAQLKKLVADLSLDKHILQDVLSKKL